MPSPFPGMDPFLENPAIFPGVHDSFIIHLREALQTALPAPYFAESSQRLWVEASDRPIGPDVDIIRGDQPSPQRINGGGVAVATDIAIDEPLTITAPFEEHRETYLEIRVPATGGERVVATIEVLSPTSKALGTRGRGMYLQKQEEILSSDSHLLEIDLLRGGSHTMAVPLDRLRRQAPDFDYHICLHSFDRFGTFLTRPVSLRQRLPRIAVPLLPGDGSVTLALQAGFDRAYDTGPYRRRLHYQPSQIVPPLPPQQQEWVIQLFRAKGLLTEGISP